MRPLAFYESSQDKTENNTANPYQQGDRHFFFLGGTTCFRFFTTPFAMRTAFPSSPEDDNTLLATSDHCRLALADVALCVCFEASE